jgi:hypothetical protein
VEYFLEAPRGLSIQATFRVGTIACSVYKCGTEWAYSTPTPAYMLFIPGGRVAANVAIGQCEEPSRRFELLHYLLPATNVVFFFKAARDFSLANHY